VKCSTSRLRTLASLSHDHNNTHTLLPQLPSTDTHAETDDVSFFYTLIGGLECVGHFFAYVAHLRILRDV
jgi:hypothetical protein